jgi:hypothetical protein
MCGIPLVDEFVDGAKAVGGTIVDGAEAVGIIGAAEDVGGWVGGAADDVGGWFSDHASDIGEAALLVGKGVVTAYTGPLGGLIVGAAEGSIRAAADGRDAGDTLEAAGWGGAYGAAGGNQAAVAAVDFAHQVEGKINGGADFLDAVRGAAQDQNLGDALMGAHQRGMGPIYEAGMHAGAAALKGGDAGDIAAAGIGGGASGWFGGGTPTGEAAAGALGGFFDGLFHNTNLLESMGIGAWEGVKHAQPGLDVAGAMFENIVHGRPIDDAFLDAGKKGAIDLLGRFGLDHDTSEKLSDFGGDLVGRLSHGESFDDALFGAAKDHGGGLLDTAGIKLPDEVGQVYDQAQGVYDQAQGAYDQAQGYTDAISSMTGQNAPAAQEYVDYGSATHGGGTDGENGGGTGIMLQPVPLAQEYDIDYGGGGYVAPFEPILH